MPYSQSTVSVSISAPSTDPRLCRSGLSFEELYTPFTPFRSDITDPYRLTYPCVSPINYVHDEEILSTLDKRPLTIDDIDALFDTQSKQRFKSLLDQGKIAQIERSNIIFFIPIENINRKRSK
jgi:hypothetical protein